MSAAEVSPAAQGAQRAADQLKRLPCRDEPMRIPRPVDGEPGLFVVDGTWGRIAPMEVAPGVVTVGELELIAHIDQWRPLIDTRIPESFALGTIPGARSVPSREILEGGVELPREPAVYFCNGPLCAATPRVIRALVEAGHPAEWILYYRGGLRDWMTLGLPIDSPVDD